MGLELFRRLVRKPSLAGPGIPLWMALGWHREGGEEGTHVSETYGEKFSNLGK